MNTWFVSRFEITNNGSSILKGLKNVFVYEKQMRQIELALEVQTLPLHLKNYGVTFITLVFRKTKIISI